MQQSAHGPSYVTIWVWLVVLVGAGLALFLFPLSHGTITVLLFAIAIVKAGLVMRHFMHLKAQPFMLYVIIFTPVVLAIGMTLTLMPDIAFR